MYWEQIELRACTEYSPKRKNVSRMFTFDSGSTTLDLESYCRKTVCFAWVACRRWMVLGQSFAIKCARWLRCSFLLLCYARMIRRWESKSAKRPPSPWNCAFVVSSVFLLTCYGLVCSIMFIYRLWKQTRQWPTNRPLQLRPSKTTVTRIWAKPFLSWKPLLRPSIHWHQR